MDKRDAKFLRYIKYQSEKLNAKNEKKTSEK